MESVSRTTQWPTFERANSSNLQELHCGTMTGYFSVFEIALSSGLHGEEVGYSLPIAQNIETGPTGTEGLFLRSEI